MNAGKKVMGKSSSAASPPNPTKTTTTFSTNPDESFASESPSDTGAAHDAPTTSSNLGDPDRTLTPDASFDTRFLSSATSSPIVGRVSRNMGQPGSTPYPGLMMPAYSQHSPPSIGSGASATHLRRLHNRRVSGSVTSHPHPHPRGDSLDNGSATPLHSRHASFDSNALSNPYLGDQQYQPPPATASYPSMEMPMSMSMSMPTSMHESMGIGLDMSDGTRKRTLSELDDIEQPAGPEKRRR